MKKIFIIMLTVATVAIMLSSCKKDEENDKIIGKWKVTSVNMTVNETTTPISGDVLPSIVFDFKKGGSGIMSLFENPIGNLTWAYANDSKDNLKITLDSALQQALEAFSPSGLNILALIPSEVNITKLTDSEFWCESLDGVTPKVELEMKKI